MITNIILVILSIIMGITMFAALIVAASLEKTKLCVRLLLTSFALLVIIQIVSRLFA